MGLKHAVRPRQKATIYLTQPRGKPFRIVQFFHGQSDRKFSNQLPSRVNIPLTGKAISRIWMAQRPPSSVQWKNMVNTTLIGEDCPNSKKTGYLVCVNCTAPTPDFTLLLYFLLFLPFVLYDNNFVTCACFPSIIRLNSCMTG